MSRNSHVVGASVPCAIATIAHLERSWQSIGDWSGFSANYLLNTYFTSEILKENEWSQLCSVFNLSQEFITSNEDFYSYF